MEPLVSMVQEVTGRHSVFYGGVKKPHQFSESNEQAVKSLIEQLNVPCTGLDFNEFQEWKEGNLSFLMTGSVVLWRIMLITPQKFVPS